MKFRELVSKRYKEAPAECQIDSQIWMMRGGYIKPVGNGIYSLLPHTLRIMRKIEKIIREEMDAIGGQEVQLPVTMPASLWQESGRYESIGKELLRFTDRSGADMVLGMTHEEAVVHLVRDVMDSYTQYPFMIYQIQTKFRDEPRARGGLIRVREFTMKDAYSFHTSMEDLDAYYMRCHAAYERIFRRVGIPEVISVMSDSGMMGGKVSHEFMLLTDVGEDTLVLCNHCAYKANMEAAAYAEGAACPVCGQHTLYTSRGIEVGNIFQLGDKYTRAMDMRYVDENSVKQIPYMGCYGIGIGRLAASVCEARHDANGPIWPGAIAPWQVHICSLRIDQDGVADASRALYDALWAQGVETIWDERAVSAGVMFSDADLMGVPVRVVVSPKGLQAGTVEISTRDKTVQQKVAVEDAVEKIRATVDLVLGL